MRPVTGGGYDSFDSPTDPLAVPAPRTESVLPSATRRREHLPGLDGIRALAVLAVVVYHVSSDWLPGGFLGVDLFFVVSGYLITDQLCGNWLASHRILARAFWLRRARRLLPALVVVVCVSVVAAAVTDHRLLVGIRGDTLAAMMFVGNWWQIATDASYFADQGQQSLLQHTWSLSVEEQFYLLWPLVLLLLMRVIRRPLVRAAVALGLAGVSLSLMALGFVPGVDNSRLYLGTDTHAFGLLVGAALALALPSVRLARGAVPRVWSDTAGCAGLAVTVVAMSVLHGDEAMLYRGGFAAVTLASAALIVGVVPVAGRLRRLAGWAPLRWIGIRSYGIYLWHWPLVVLMSSSSGLQARTRTDQLVLLGCVVTVTLVCAAASYRWVEQPIRRDGFRRSLRHITTAWKNGGTP